MPRAGAGGGSSAGRSGGHSVGHSSGGHHVGAGSARPGESGGGSFGGMMGAGGPRKDRDNRNDRRNAPPRGGRMGTGPRGGFGAYGNAGRTSIVGNSGRVLGCGTSMVITTVIIFFAVIILAIMLTTMGGNSGNVAEATATSLTNRTKLTDVADFNSNCITDELEWIYDVATTEEGLEQFYKKTGIQPYIVIRGYDATLSTDEEKEEWANTYFNENISEENAFLFVYFAEQNSSENIGYMCYVSGASASTILDTEAMNVFWDNIDRYWVSDLSTDQVFIQAYTDTATTIMKHHASKGEIARNIIIVVLIIAALVFAFYMYKEKNRRAAQKAKETKEILETPLEKMGDESDELIRKYGNVQKQEKEN
jgi:uncharacterized protein YpmB